MNWRRLLLLLAFVPAIHSLAATDEIQDADPAQSGYLDNHNLHPATVGSPIFGFLWKNKYGQKEKWYAKPLVYTPTGGNQTQLVFLASSMNIIRTVDAVTGATINTRLVQNPFLQSDIGCTDIPDYIGIIGTPIIDPNTDTVYFFSKGYKNNATSGGVANGIYQFFAVDINTLQDRPNFPVLIDGHNADSDPTRYFIGGTVLQRPSLTMVNGVVIGAFGGHCDLFNYTGMIVGVSTNPGVGVTGLYTMESSPGAPPVQDDIMKQVGGKAGIWAGGMGIATDANRIFFATGNGLGHSNGQTPASGRTPMDTLDEVVANFAVSPTGKFSLTDYFEPFEYMSMDAGDRDLGSGGVALLDPAVFKGTGVSRIAVTIGKNGKAYIMNANNLGGFKQGAGGVDNVIQTIVAAGSVFGGSGSYPLEGGYIYFTPVGFPTVCYKLGRDSNGKPQFTQVGATARNSAGRVGVGIPTITSYKGQPGTGILWITDPDAGLQAFSAVPDVNEILQPVATFATGGLNKFQRPAFGDGRLYVSDNNGNVMCLGSPVALPLQCSQPVDFGSVTIGSIATQIVNCTALIQINSINGCTTGDSTFKCLNSTLPRGVLSQGATFSFPVTWDLTQASVNDAQNASFGKVLPGVKSTALTLFTTNNVPKYSTELPISLQGVTVSNDPFLTVSPPELDFGGLVVGTGGNAQSSTLNIIISNLGSQALAFTGLAWTSSLFTNPIVWNNITADGSGSYITGTDFASSLLPQVGDTIASGSSITLPITFTTNSVGSYHSALEFWTTGGNANIILVGSGSTAPIANISASTIEGGWDFSEPLLIDFGNVLAGTTQSRTLRLCNSGGSALEITKSKPPIDPELTAVNPLTDLHEGQYIDVNACASGEINIIADPLGVNRPPHTVSDVWILNTDDLTFGVHDIGVTANIVTRQVGPLMPDGTARFLYLGCYADRTRQLQKNFNNNTGNENGWCQSNCLANGYAFAGTEYHTECWCGNFAPHVALYTPESAKMCTFSCVADPTQACGGDGTYISIYYDRTRYTPDAAAIPSAPTASGTGTGTVSATSVVATPSPTGGLVIVPSVGTYSYVGCYSEATTGRALTGKSYSNDSMTIESCASFCGAFSYFGVEYARECYCGSIPQAGSAAGSIACTMTCKGNSLEYCGGSKALQMYNKLVALSSMTTSSSNSGSPSSSSSTTSATSSSISTSVSLSTSSSASTSVTSSSISTSSSSPSSTSSSSSSNTSSSSSSSTSSSSPSSTSSSSPSSTSSSSPSSTSSSSPSSTSSSSPSSTSSIPSSISSSSPSSTFSSISTSDVSTSSSSTSYQSSASTLTTSSTSSSSSTTTSTTSALQPTQTGPRIVPSVGAYNYVGCYSEATTGRALASKSYADDLMTVESCAAFCQGYTYFGVEYARECYCGNSPNAGSVVGSTACTKLCKGNPLEYCGGSKALNMYNNLAVSSSSIASTTSSTGLSSITSTTTSSSTLTSSTSLASTTSTTSTTSLTTSSTDSSSPSSTTTTSSFTTSDTDSSSAAFSTTTASTLTTSSTDSSSATPSTTTTSSLTTSSTDSSSAPSTTSVSSSSPTSSTSIITSPAPTTFTSSTISSATSSSTGLSGFFPQGCFYDPAGGPFAGHNMPLLFTNSTGMTVEQCISSALARLTAVPATTYAYCGLEYGRECYCRTAAPSPEPTRIVGPKACTMTCKGNSNELCGGSNMYNLYASGPSITGTVTGTAIWSSAPAVSTKS